MLDFTLHKNYYFFFFFLANALHQNTLLVWKKEDDCLEKSFPARSYSLVVAAVDCLYKALSV